MEANYTKIQMVFVLSHEISKCSRPVGSWEIGAIEQGTGSDRKDVIPFFCADIL